MKLAEFKGESKLVDIKDKELIKEIQKALQIPIDGVVGEQTSMAFAQFKRQRWLSAPGTLGESTAKLLISFPKLLVTSEKASAIFQAPVSDKYIRDLDHCLNKFGISTPQRIRHFLAQVGHESGGLRWMIELASGAAYEGREDLGNTQSGDGPKYKGAGALQLTGRANYAAFAKYYADRRILEIGASYVASIYPFSSAGAWWLLNDINELVDAGATCRQISARVNGRDPANGLSDRIAYFTRACRMI